MLSNVASRVEWEWRAEKNSRYSSRVPAVLKNARQCLLNQAEACGNSSDRWKSPDSDWKNDKAVFLQASLAATSFPRVMRWLCRTRSSWSPRWKRFWKSGKKTAANPDCWWTSEAGSNPRLFLSWKSIDRWIILYCGEISALKGDSQTAACLV